MTEEVKAKLSKAKSEEEAKKILEENNAELTKEELEAVSGGTIFADLMKKCTGSGNAAEKANTIIDQADDILKSIL